MTLGTDWNQRLPRSDPAHSKRQMERAADRCRFVLDRPIVDKPGTRWVYNCGCAVLLGHLIAAGTGKPLDAFAQEVLFDPLGITRFEWIGGSNGAPSASGGLRLSARDLARIGQLIPAQGKCKGRQIVPASWLRGCMTPAAAIGDGRHYSRQWALSAETMPAADATRLTLSAIGNGGQRLSVVPSLDLAVVTLAGNYNRPDHSAMPALILREIVLANLERV